MSVLPPSLSSFIHDAFPDTPPLPPSLPISILCSYRGCYNYYGKLFYHSNELTYNEIASDDIKNMINEKSNKSEKENDNEPSKLSLNNSISNFNDCDLHLIPLLEYYVEEKGNNEGKSEDINNLLVKLYVERIRKLKLMIIIKVFSLMIEQEKNKKVNEDVSTISHISLNIDGGESVLNGNENLEKRKVDVENDNSRKKKSFKISKDLSQSYSENHSTNTELNFSSTSEFTDDGKSKYKKYTKKTSMKSKSKVHSFSNSYFYRPLLSEPKDILFLRLRLLFFLKYSFYYNPKRIYRFFFKKKQSSKEKEGFCDFEKSKKVIEIIEEKKAILELSEIPAPLILEDENEKLGNNGEDKTGINSTLESTKKSYDKNSFSSVILSSPIDNLPSIIAPFLFFNRYEFCEEKIILLNKMRKHKKVLSIFFFFSYYFIITRHLKF
jgi:hypothetical protein